MRNRDQIWSEASACRIELTRASGEACDLPRELGGIRAEPVVLLGVQIHRMLKRGSSKLEINDLGLDQTRISDRDLGPVGDPDRSENPEREKESPAT